MTARAFARRSVVVELGLLSAIAVIHAGGWISAGVAVDGVAPFTLASARFLLAGTTLVILARLRGASMGTNDWPSLLLAALIGVALAHALLYSGLRRAPVADGVVLSTALVPIFAILFATLLLRERASLGALGGAICGSVGVGLVVLGATSADASGNRVAGDLLVIAGTAATSLYAVIGKKAMLAGTPLGVTASTTLLGGIALAPLALMEASQASGSPWSLQTWVAFLYLTFPSAGLSSVLFFILVRRTGVARSSIVSYVVPVLVLAWSAVVAREPVTIPSVVGAGLAVLGVSLVMSGTKSPHEGPSTD